MKRLVVAALWTVAIAVTGIVFAIRTPPAALVAWVAGPEFNRILSQSVSHALKVDGRFGPMTLLPDWSVAADNFTSRGWPGQAIGALDTGRARGSFDLWGLFRGEWNVPLIEIDKAKFVLVSPNEALKAQDPAASPKPWYASLMPSRFNCGWIDCPNMSIELPFGQATVRGESQHVGAMMIGQNFKYFGRGGRLCYPEYPPMAVDAFEVYVTREMIDIGYLYLREPQSPRSNLQLAVRLGQHADKAIKASAKIDGLDIVPFLPADVAGILAGKLSGSLAYATDTSGRNITGGGTVSLTGGELKNWEYLDRLAALSGDDGFKRIVINDASVAYALVGDVIRVDNIQVRAGGGFVASGCGSWNTQTSAATTRLAIDGIPIGAYLPPEIAGSLGGSVGGTVEWAWTGTDLARGSGGGTLRLHDTRLSGFQFQEFLDRFFKTHDYAEISLAEAGCRWRQDSSGLYLEDINILSPGRAGLRGSIHIAPDGKLSGILLAGLPASALRWLPEATTTVFARNEGGLHWCSLKVRGTEHKPETDFTMQVLRQLEKHPEAAAELAARGVSWWLGDVLRTKAADEAG